MTTAIPCDSCERECPVCVVFNDRDAISKLLFMCEECRDAESKWCDSCEAYVLDTPDGMFRELEDGTKMCASCATETDGKGKK